MTIPYSTNLPNPPDDPADDVAGMQINTGSIATIIAVDHVGFNVGGGGQHKQVTFNSNNVPVGFPVNPPVAFTNAITGGNNGLFFYSGSAAESSNQYVLTGNGSTLLMGGIIIKWGSYTLAPSVVSTPVTFASAFPNNIFAITSGSNVSGSPNDAPRIISQTTTGFVGGRINSVSPLGGTYTYYYIAIGN